MLMIYKLAIFDFVVFIDDLCVSLCLLECWAFGLYAERGRPGDVTGLVMKEKLPEPGVLSPRELKLLLISRSLNNNNKKY